MLRTSLGVVLVLSGIKLLEPPQANWILGGGLIAGASALAAYGVRVWLARPRVQPYADRA